MSKALIAGYCRSPFHFARKGALKEVRPDDLVSQVIRTLVERTGVDASDIEDVILGCSYPEAEQGRNIARIASLLAGLPNTLGGMTVNRFCGSSMSAVHYAAGQIALGAGHAFICGGVESMSRVPQGGFNNSPNPRMLPSGGSTDAPLSGAYIPMGFTAENVAEQHDVERNAQEEFAAVSHRKAAQARSQGRLTDEIVPIADKGAEIVEDGCIRPGTTPEVLSELKPVFREDGVVTAGTSSPLTDGASALLVCSEDFARSNGLPAMARVRSVAVAGLAPEIMGMGPVPATQKALARAGLTVGEIGIFEINEAFASQAVATMRELGVDPDRTNLDGGALAIGHPLGATGARITGKAAQLLSRERVEFSLATQCIGGGQGIATVLEAV